MVCHARISYSNKLITIAPMTFEMNGMIFIDCSFFSSGNLSPIQVLKMHLETTNYDKGIRPDHVGANSANH